MRVALFFQDQMVRRVEAHRAELGEAENIIEFIKESGGQLMAESDEPVRACGIGFGGPVDFEAQRIRASMHVGGWDGVSLSRMLTDAWGIPAVMDNDALVGAIGEYHDGAGKGTDSFVYVTVSTGVGGGLILGGKPYRGHFGLAGEIGHIPVLWHGGRPCVCGSEGCLEAYCAGPAIASRAAQYENSSIGAPLDEGKISLKGGTGVEDGSPALTARTVFSRAGEGDEKMQQVVEETGIILGTALTGVINVLDPERIAIGGGVSQAGEPLFARVRETVKTRLATLLQRDVSIVPAALGDDSVLYGAYRLAQNLI